MKNGEKQYSLRGLNSVFFGFLLIMLTGIIGSAAKGILALNVTDPKYAVYWDYSYWRTFKLDFD